MALRISRRAALKGMGGVAVALPALEIMFDRHGQAYAQGQPIPKRYLVCFGGQSLAHLYVNSAASAGQRSEAAVHEAAPADRRSAIASLAIALLPTPGRPVSRMSDSSATASRTLRRNRCRGSLDVRHVVSFLR